MLFIRFLARYNFHEVKTYSRNSYLRTMIDVAEGRLNDPVIMDLC